MIVAQLLVFVNETCILKAMDDNDITPIDMQREGLSNYFLIAMPALEASHFHQSVTYICEHNANGAIGLVVNHPLNITLGELFAQMNIACDAAVGRTPLFTGGPVQAERGFLLHSREKSWESTFAVSDDIGITASRDILEDIAHNRGPAEFLVTLGYAGWGAGQLEHEMSVNSWLTVAADKRIIFDTPSERRWTAAALLLGVDMHLIASHAGHG